MNRRTFFRRAFQAVATAAAMSYAPRVLAAPVVVGPPEWRRVYWDQHPTLEFWKRDTPIDLEGSGLIEE